MLAVARRPTFRADRQPGRNNYTESNPRSSTRQEGLVSVRPQGSATESVGWNGTDQYRDPDASSSRLVGIRRESGPVVGFAP